MSGSRPSSFSLTTPGRFRMYSTAELFRLPPPEWLIRGVVPAGGMVGLYGVPGHGKTFVAIDMAMAVATGRPWQGHPTKKGYVVYVSAEGGTGIGKRVKAWTDEYAVKEGDPNIAWMTEPMSVTGDDEGDVDGLLERIHNEIREDPAMVVIDTLARCFDGNENEQEDMGRFVVGVDRLRLELNSTVTVVHHTRLDADRERGSTAFRGAADSMIFVKQEKDESILISCSKQKDAEAFPTMKVRLKVRPVEVGGMQTDSCVVVSEKFETTFLILRELADDAALSFTELKEALAVAKVSPATLKRRLSQLLEQGKIRREEGLYLLGSASEDA